MRRYCINENLDANAMVHVNSYINYEINAF